MASSRAPTSEGAGWRPWKNDMPRKGWTTISIPDELYEALRRHVPAQARSVQAYVIQAARISCLLDDLRTRAKETTTKERPS